MKQPSLENLRDYALYLLEILKIGGDSISEDQSKMAAEFIKGLSDLINHVYERKSRSKMKELISELEIPLKLYDPNIFIFIKEDVFERFNIQLGSQKEEKKLKEIVKRGTVKSEKEYRLVRGFIEIFEADKTKGKIVSNLIYMLDEFDLRLSKKRKSK